MSNGTIPFDGGAVTRLRGVILQTENGLKRQQFLVDRVRELETRLRNKGRENDALLDRVRELEIRVQPVNECNEPVQGVDAFQLKFDELKRDLEKPFELLAENLTKRVQSLEGFRRQADDEIPSPERMIDIDRRLDGLEKDAEERALEIADLMTRLDRLESWMGRVTEGGVPSFHVENLTRRICALEAAEAITELSASEALYGFCSWLTCRDETTKLGAMHDVAPVVDAIREYCQMNKLPSPREGWHNILAAMPASGVKVL